MSRRWLPLAAALLLVAIAAAAIAPLRRAALVRIGRHLSESDAPAPADMLVMDLDSGFAGAIKLSDLYREHPAPVGLLVPRKSELDEALLKRRIELPDVILDVLLQLGIPRHAIVEMPAGEGGTTETAAALAEWSRANPSGRLVVVVAPSHGRRYKRALLRAWPEGHSTPRVVTTQYALFRADDWWQSRRTVRDGLEEIEKLGLDYLLYPW